MTPQQYQRAVELFRAASTLEPDDRQRFMRQAADEPAVVERATDMLDRHDMKGHALDAPGPGATLVRAAVVGAERDRDIDPERIGSYRIVERLGEGGMGVVYAAEQARPKRDVAIKVLRGVLSPQRRRRFDDEARALARLQHPGIATIFEAGIARDDDDREVPFIAMELVDGPQLLSYVQKQNLDTIARLELVAQVCEAVHRAHLRGVVHRDLKPANILVSLADGSPRAKVLDFGIARLVDDGGDRSPDTDRIGTLPYMSPEQLAGDTTEIDVRTDVYALGVVTHELLWGRLPQSNSPTPPSTAAPDVDLIVAKAIAHEPDARYASAGDLAADIRRYLRYEPITARPTSMGYRIRCFARRNRALVALTTALGVALVAGTVVAFTLAINANLARNRAQTEARVVSALNDFIRDDLLRQADPDDQPDRNLTLRAALDEAATRIALRFDERPEIAGRLHESVGQTYLGLGELDAAEYHLDLACALLGEHLGAEDPATLRARSSRGPLLHARGRFADGLAEMQAVSARQIAMLGREHRDVLVTRFHLGTMLIGLGRETEAVAVLKDVLDARRDRGEHETYKTLQVIRRLSNAERSLGLWADCEAHVREGLEICRSTLGEDHAAAAGFLESLGLVAREQGQYEEARTWIERAIAIHTTTRGPDHRRTLAAHTSLATVLRRLGSIDEAARLDEAVLEARTRTLGAEHPKTLVSLNAVALNAMERGDLDHAATLLEDALERHRRVLGDEHRDTLATLFNLALVRTRQESWEAAAELFAEAVRLARLQHPADHWRIGHFMLGHGRALAGLMRYDEAEPLLHEAHRILNGALGDRHRRTCKAAEFIADLYEQTGDAERAARWTERATASPTP